MCVCVCEGQFVLIFPYFSTSERAFLELLSPVQTKMAECEGMEGEVDEGERACVSVFGNFSSKLGPEGPCKKKKCGGGERERKPSP